MFEGPDKKRQKLAQKLENVRAQVVHAQHAHERAQSSEKKHQMEEGRRAAKYDMGKIVKLIEKKMANGEEFLELGSKFKSDAPNLQEKKLRNNSPEFVAGYADELRDTLGKETFFVTSHSHHREAHVRILWSPRATGGGHH